MKKPFLGVFKWLAVSSVLILGLAACGGESAVSAKTTEQQVPVMQTVEGVVLYRERRMLPPGVEVEVQLQDVSRADAPAVVLGDALLTPLGGPPYAFSIDYDPSQIRQNMRYALRATIKLEGKLLFTTMDHIDAFSGNPVEVLVKMVPRQTASVGPQLEGGSWLLQTLNGDPASLGAGAKQLDLNLQAAEQRAAGFAGCNRFHGGYARDGSSALGSPLSFSPMGATMMACAEGMELEQSYLQMFGSVAAFRLTEGGLSLLSGAGEVLATFKAQ